MIGDSGETTLHHLNRLNKKEKIKTEKDLKWTKKKKDLVTS